LDVQFCHNGSYKGFWYLDIIKRPINRDLLFSLYPNTIHIKFEVIWIAISLSSRIRFCLAVMGLFSIIFQNLFCFYLFCSCQYIIIIFGIFGCCLSHFHHFYNCLFSISFGPNKSQICNFESKLVFFLSWTIFLLCLRLLLFFLFVSCIQQGRGNGGGFYLKDAKN
jgi:hypothetical protein